MNTLNRIVVVVLLAIATVLCCVLLAGAKWVVPTLAGQLDLLTRSLESAPGYQAVVLGIILAFVVDFIFVLLIILEVRRPKAKFIRVEKVAGGEVEVSVTSIVDRLRHEVDALPGVLKVKPRVSGRRGGVVVHLDVDIAAGLDVPAQAEQIVETARLVVEERIGLKMAKTPKVSLRAVPYPQGALPSNRIKMRPPVEPPPEELASPSDEE